MKTVVFTVVSEQLHRKRFNKPRNHRTARIRPLIALHFTLIPLGPDHPGLKTVTLFPLHWGWCCSTGGKLVLLLQICRGGSRGQLNMFGYLTLSSKL